MDYCYPTTTTGSAMNLTIPTTRSFVQQSQPHPIGNYRFPANGQQTNSASLYQNSNTNTILGGSALTAGYSSGGQFNFPARPSANGNKGFKVFRTNSQPSPNRKRSHASDIVADFSNSGGHFQETQQQGNNNSRLGTEQVTMNPRKSTSKPNRKQQNETSNKLHDMTASLAGISLNQTQSDQPELPQYRIFKRGDSLLSGIDENSTSVSVPPDMQSSVVAEKVTNEKSNISDKENEAISLGASSGVGTEPTSNNHTNNPTSRTPLTQLAEIGKFHGLCVEYRLISETGPPHCPIFTVALHVGEQRYEGKGPSIKKSQIAAAMEALEKTTLQRPPVRYSKRNFNSWQGQKQGRTPQWAMAQLISIAEELNQPVHFANHPVASVSQVRAVTPINRVAVYIGNRIFTGEGNSFHSAKHMAVLVALKALSKVKREKDEEEKTPTVEEGAPNEEIEDGSKNPISIAYEMASKRGLQIRYEIIREAGPAHMKVFTVQCKVGEILCSESDGFTKQHAKKLASELMITKLKELPAAGESDVRSLQRNFVKPKVIKKKKPLAPIVKEIEKASVSPISRLIQIAHLRKYKEPEFYLVENSSGSTMEPETSSFHETPHGRQHKRHLKLKKPYFEIEVKVGPHMCRGEGPNKKAAKKAAADRALVLLGYPPSDASAEPMKSKPETLQTPNREVVLGFPENTQPSTSKGAGTTNTSRQIVPGLLILPNNQLCAGSKNAEPESSKTFEKSPVVEIPKPLTPTQLETGNYEATNKLSYLGQLLGVQVSYSDFPKKNEYLSVVSLGTTPPHVSHGIGATMEDARNNAAIHVLNELSDKGLDADPKAPMVSSRNPSMIALNNEEETTTLESD